MEFFKQTVNSEDTCGEKAAIPYAVIQSSNISGNVPKRFHSAYLKDCSEPFVEELKNFALTKDNEGVFIIFGDVGTGKTYLACSAMHERVLNNLDAGIYLSCRYLCPLIRASRSFSAKQNESELYDYYSKVPFLVIDEVGRGDTPEMEWQFICTILAMRYDNMLPTIICTNFSASNFKTYISGQNGQGNDILDRLSAVIIPKNMTGYSRRKHA